MSLDRWWSWVLVAALLGCGSGAEQPPPVEPPPPQDPPHAPTDAGTFPAHDLVPGDLGSFAVLGTGRDLIREEMRAQCAVVETARAPVTPAPFVSFEHPLAVEDAARLMGLPPDGLRPFTHELEWPWLLESPLSRVYAYAAEVTVDRERVTGVSSWLVEPGGALFDRGCADEAVAGIAWGGRILLVFRYRFPEESDRQAFERVVGERPAAWDLAARVEALSASASRPRFAESVLLEAKGPTELISLGDPLTACFLGAPGGCASMVDALVERLPGLAEASRASSAALGYTLSPWTALAPAAAPPRDLPDALAGARAALLLRRAAQRKVGDAIAAAATWSFAWPGEEDLDVLADGVERNLSVLQDAIDRCAYTDDLLGEGLEACVEGATDEALEARGYDPTLTLDRVVF